MEATKIPPPQQMEDKEEKESPEDEEGPKNGGGWGGWVFSTFSVLSDLQKAAAVAAEEIALNASGVAENAAKTIAVFKLPRLLGIYRRMEAERGLEHSAVNFADSMNHGGLPAGSVAPSLIKTRKPFTTKGMQVLEYVGKETMENEQSSEEDRLLEKVSFNQWFYIYGGSEQLEELEALSSHYALLFNRRKTTLPTEQKSMYEGKLKEIQLIFTSDSGMDGNDLESAKGKTKDSHDEMKILHDSSIRKYADMAVGFINALAGLAVNDIIQRTTRRLESLHPEGVHLVSETCCLAVSHLLMLDPDDDDGDDIMNIEWPEDPVEKAKLIRSATVDSHEALPQASIQEKAKSFSKHLHDDRATAVSKI
ncbi:hypothetical protein V6Z11_D01G005100 [Gossypium hirsutum]